MTEARINGKRARLAFDTGSGISALVPEAAKRLGLSFTNPPPKDLTLRDGEVSYGTTEQCEIMVGGCTSTGMLGIVEVPKFLKLNIDGVIGWPAVSNNILSVDARALDIAALTEIPTEATNWLKLKVRNNETLVLEIPGLRPRTIRVDTGDDCGVKLCPERWREWRAAHKTQPATLDAFFSPESGLTALEQAWARELSLGKLRLIDVPVSEADRGEIALGGPDYEGTFGLAALKRVDFIVDGVAGVAYLRPRPPPGESFQHNRLGAVFMPRNSEGEYLIARVVERSPAYEAGIRNGDILLSIGDLDVTRWRTDPTVLPLSRFWERPSGTKVKLSLKRNGKTFEATPVLRQIVGPNTPSAPSIQPK